MIEFRAPSQSFGSIDAETAGRLLTTAADVALVVDHDGVIRDLAVGNEDLAQEGYDAWVGRPWIQTVTIESRPKIEALLRDAGASGAAGWRHINHPSTRGADVPILYSALRAGLPGGVVAVGRNLRTVSALQQRLVDAQQAIERDYARLRHAETRYRLLFQLTCEAILIVDAASQKVIEANPVAVQLLGNSSKEVVGKQFPDDFHAADPRGLMTLLAAVRSAGHAELPAVRLGSSGRTFGMAASLFRQDRVSHFLIRLAPLGGLADAASPQSRQQSTVLQALDALPDGFVVTELDGRVITCNRAFLDLVQLATEEQVRGQSLDQWLGRPGVDMSVLIANLRQHGSVRLFATALRGAFGGTAEVEISAVSVAEGPEPCLAFTVRNVGRRLTLAATRSQQQLPRSVDQLTELIGRVPLKDIVRETTDVIERLCIEAALELTRDNRASAAEMLGLSRQSLYVKLHRYGLGDFDVETTQ